MNLFVDCETFSRADLRRVGAHQYARDPSTELLLVAYQLDDDVLGRGPVVLWDRATSGPRVPDELRDLLPDPAVTLTAFNATFEMAIFEAAGVLAFDPSRWVCVQALALSWGLPASLAGVGDALGFTGARAKASDGQRLIRTFSVPQPKTGRRIMPQDQMPAWQRFGDYCRQDVVAEREIFARLA